MANIAKDLYNSDESKNHAKFLVGLQTIMTAHGVNRQQADREPPGKPVRGRHL